MSLGDTSPNAHATPHASLPSPRYSNMHRRSQGKYYIHTFGCQMNLADSERMAGVLESLGYACTQEAGEASVMVMNTCSIREKAELKVSRTRAEIRHRQDIAATAIGSRTPRGRASPFAHRFEDSSRTLIAFRPSRFALQLYSALGDQAKRKRKNVGDLKIIVAGCVAQQEGEQLLRRVPEVDIVMGPQFANKIGDLLDRVEQVRAAWGDWPTVMRAHPQIIGCPGTEGLGLESWGLGGFGLGRGRARHATLVTACIHSSIRFSDTPLYSF